MQHVLLEQSYSGTSGGYIIKFISAGFCRLERICFTIKVTTQIHSLTQHTQRPMKIYEILKTFQDLLVLKFKNKICLMMTSSKVGSKPVEICGVLSTCLKSSKDNETEITTQEGSKNLKSPSNHITLLGYILDSDILDPYQDIIVNKMNKSG